MDVIGISVGELKTAGTAPVAVPVPTRLTEKEPVSGSLLAMWMAAARTLAVDGVKSTVNVAVRPGATGGLGVIVIEKSALLVPSFVIVRPVRVAVPLLRIVKTRGTWL